MAVEILLSDQEEAEFAAFLHERIRNFNTEHSPHHRAARAPGAVRPLRLLVKNAAGQAVGGLAGQTFWDWLEIEHFYLPEELRGQGLGADLLRRAEDAARARGARHCFLTTFEFQARRFYMSQGYRVTGMLEGYPPGSAYYWMTKEL